MKLRIRPARYSDGMGGGPKQDGFVVFGLDARGRWIDVWAPTEPEAWRMAGLRVGPPADRRHTLLLALLHVDLLIELRRRNHGTAAA